VPSLGIGEQGMLSPGLLSFLGALGPGHQAPEGIFLEGVEDEGAETHLAGLFFPWEDLQKLYFPWVYP